MQMEVQRSEVPIGPPLPPQHAAGEQTGRVRRSNAKKKLLVEENKEVQIAPF